MPYIFTLALYQTGKKQTKNGYTNNSKQCKEQSELKKNKRRSNGACVYIHKMLLLALSLSSSSSSSSLMLFSYITESIFSLHKSKVMTNSKLYLTCTSYFNDIEPQWTRGDIQIDIGTDTGREALMPLSLRER